MENSFTAKTAPGRGVAVTQGRHGIAPELGLGPQGFSFNFKAAGGGTFWKRFLGPLPPGAV